MFGTKTQTTAQDVFDHRGPVRVLKLDFNPEKAEEALSAWLAGGWTLKSTEAVAINGQTVFILAFLERKPRQ